MGLTDLGLIIGETNLRGLTPLFSARVEPDTRVARVDRGGTHTKEETYPKGREERGTLASRIGANSVPLSAIPKLVTNTME